jgi:hypothetical protein
LITPALESQTSAVPPAFCAAALGVLGMRRVMQMPDNAGTDGVGYGFDYPVFSIDITHDEIRGGIRSRPASSPVVPSKTSDLSLPT